MKKISDFNNATEKYPVVYAGSATRPEYVDMPTILQQQEGVAPLETCPAQWWNAMWKLATKDINAFRDFVGDAFTEINNLLTKFNITLDDADSEQLYDFFHDDYVQNYLNGIFVNKSGDTIDGDLHIKGDLSVDGIGEEIISTELKVGANTITLRNGNPSALGNTELAGVVTENYDGNNHNNIISVDKNGVARTGDIDIATRLLYSNDATNFYTDEDLTIPATIGATEEVRDTGNQTSGGVEIYEGITYSNNDTQAIATREDNPVDGAFMKWDEATKKLVSASASVQFDIAWPIGVTYTQYPGQKSPNELWSQFSTWEELDYGGAFFRSNGGNADSFDANIKAITSVSGSTITIVNHGASVGTVIFDFTKDSVGQIIRNESRIVTAVNGDVLTLNSQFTSTDLRNVLIGQSDAIRSHSHNMSHKHTINHGHTAQAYYASSGGSTGFEWHGGGGSTGSSPLGKVTVANHSGYSSYDLYNNASSPTKITNTGNTGGTETRGTNFTIKVWVRTA